MPIYLQWCESSLGCWCSQVRSRSSYPRARSSPAAQFKFAHPANTKIDQEILFVDLKDALHSALCLIGAFMYMEIFIQNYDMHCCIYVSKNVWADPDLQYIVLKNICKYCKYLSDESWKGLVLTGTSFYLCYGEAAEDSRTRLFSLNTKLRDSFHFRCT